MYSSDLGRARPSTSMIDKYLIIPISACVYTIMVAPLLAFITTTGSGRLSATSSLQVLMTPRPENKIFWPAAAAISLLFAAQNRSRLTFPPHIICLISYLVFTGVSVLWAFKPEFALTRFVLQVTILTSIILPAILAARTADMMRSMFLCFAFASILNVPFVLEQNPIIALDGLIIGYPGYFSFKGTLGECAALALLLSLNEMIYRGRRRAFGIIIFILAIWIMDVSKSKGSLAMALIAPLAAQLTLIIGNRMRISPAVVLLPIVLCYEVLSRIPGANIVNRISYWIYGNYTLSGRTVIWDFVNNEIARRPILGWGYQSFWLVGPDAPSVVEAPGWVKNMPSAHNGNLDTILDTGYIGFFLFLIFTITTFHAIGRVANHDPARGRLLLSLALFITLTNALETVWMHGMDILWVAFVIVVAEIARHQRPFRPDGHSQDYSRTRGTVSRAPSRPTAWA
jgi:exopolysaccharide production protein ExoQ